MTLCMRAQLYAIMGQTLLAIVIIDNRLISRNYLDRAKALAVKQTKLRTDRILVAATHTHTTPPDKDRLTNRNAPQHRAYFQQLVEGIAEAITKAEKNLAPAEMAHGGYGTLVGTCTLEITASVKIQNELLKMLEKVAQKD